MKKLNGGMWLRGDGLPRACKKGLKEAANRAKRRKDAVPEMW
jgi:hypothetical protein